MIAITKTEGTPMTLIPVEELKKRVASIAIKGGIPAEDADMLAETLVVTDMRGPTASSVLHDISTASRQAESNQPSCL